MFERAQIQEFKEAFTIMDQNRDGFIDENDLRDTFAAVGEMEKLKGTDPEETILSCFKVFDPEGKGYLGKNLVTNMLTTQADRFSQEEMEQMFTAFPPDVAGNLDYKNLVYIITHGEEKDQK
uniref:Myosin, light chain 2b, regulatory, cardiac, slow n=1 Tax=Electrophorus electricus TaxID=8005 RepID=A0A4W4FGU9_ELEEL